MTPDGVSEQHRERAREIASQYTYMNDHWRERLAGQVAAALAQAEADALERAAAWRRSERIAVVYLAGCEKKIAALRAVLAPILVLAEKIKPEPLAWELHAENEWSIGVVLHHPREGQDAGDGYITGQAHDDDGDIAMSIAHNGNDSRNSAWPALIVALVNALPALRAALGGEGKG